MQSIGAKLWAVKIESRSVVVLRPVSSAAVLRPVRPTASHGDRQRGTAFNLSG